MALDYASYLHVAELLQLQRPLSAGPEHDEMLFIVVHQNHELWFKQLLHELAALQADLEADRANPAVRALNRILTILKTLVAQFDILETMTPSAFAAFRGDLDMASGFQSFQFRELEAVLGARSPALLRHLPPDSEGLRHLEERLRAPSLFDSFLTLLVKRGRLAPEAARRPDPTQAPRESPAVQEALLAIYRGGDADLAVMCERLVDLDEGLQEWRYRHLKVVERTIGTKEGTGRSTGVEYLKGGIFRHLFPDLWAVRAAL